MPLDLRELYGAIKQNYTIFLSSFGKIDFDDFEVQGSRIGVVAEDVSFKNGAIDSNGRGCLSGQGLSPG